MRKKISCILVLLFLISIVSSCKYEKDDDDGMYCPSCNEDVTWDSYGNLFIGDPSLSPDARGWDLLKYSCGWHTNGISEGGEGMQLWFYCENEGVILIWAFNEFWGIILYENWGGQTAEGIRMGDSKQKFLKTYPRFKYWRDNYYLYERECPRKAGGIAYILAEFDEEDRLICLDID